MRTKSLRWAGAVLALSFACEARSTRADEVTPASVRIPVSLRPLPGPPCDCPPPPYLPPVEPLDGPPGTMPEVPAPDAGTPDTGTPEVPELPEQPQPFDTPSDLNTVTNNLPQVASATRSVAPGMIGDMFGGMGSSMSGLTLRERRTFPFDGNTPGGGGNFSGFNPITMGSFDPVAFAVSNPSTTVFSVQNLSTLESDPNVDTIGSSFALQEDSAITAATLSATGGQIVFVNGSAVLVTNGTAFPGVYSGDFYNLFVTYDIFDSMTIAIPSPGSGGGASVGRQKIGENTSPLPRDRVFVNYSYFDNTSIFNGVDVSRITPGFERTFYDGLMSFEARFPFASTLDSDIMAAGGTNTDEIEFGNVTLYLKGLLWEGGRRNDLAVSAGIGMTLPTADDVRVIDAAGRPLVVVENEAIHVLPFLGALYTPNDRFFAQAFLQGDFDTNGNTVEAVNFGTGNLGRAGVANDTTFLFADVGVGYWVHQTNDPNAFVQGVAPTLEMHYNRSLNDADVIVSGPFRVGDFAENIEIWNAVAGVNVQCRNDLIVTAGYTAPIGGGQDQQFDGEFRLIVNWFFGNTNRRTRAQF